VGINFKIIKKAIKFGFIQNLFKFTKGSNEIDRKETTFKNNKTTIEKWLRKNGYID
jgi:hypothetical protein